MLTVHLTDISMRSFTCRSMETNKVILNFNSDLFYKSIMNKVDLNPVDFRFSFVVQKKLLLLLLSLACLLYVVQTCNFVAF